MKIFVISDLHFNHKNIIQYSNRPFSSVAEMNEVLIENWNKEVGPDDRVHVLGDICLGPKSEMKSIVDRLNGEIILNIGNHEGILHAYPERFSRIQNYIETTFIIGGAKQPVCLMHYPIEVWNNCHKGWWHLHGHCHGNLSTHRAYRFDVGVDNIAKWLHKRDLDANVTSSIKADQKYYRPLNVEELAEVFANDVFVGLDHHNE